MWMHIAARQIDADMPHNGKLKQNELGADPKYVFLPARHLNARECPSIQLDVDFRRAMPAEIDNDIV